MKTAISLPDELFERADRLARRKGKTRSELYREAIEEYLFRYDEDRITRAYDELAKGQDTSLDPWGSTAARHALERDEW